jgi:hypothetical protein
MAFPVGGQSLRRAELGRQPNAIRAAGGSWAAGERADRPAGQDDLPYDVVGRIGHEEVARPIVEQADRPVEARAGASSVHVSAPAWGPPPSTPAPAQGASPSRYLRRRSARRLRAPYRRLGWCPAHRVVQRPYRV